MESKPPTVLRWATVITDASWCPYTGAAGWAAYIRVDETPVAIKRYGPLTLSPKTSVEAEMQAAINGLYVAMRNGAEAVKLQSDCMAVIQSINAPKHDLRRAAFDSILETHGISFRVIRVAHVKGHTSGADARHWANNWCDEHARKSMLSQRVLIQQRKLV